MIDQAGIMMAQGNTVACERISGVNDNMSQSHYHDYFELYYLETGNRYHMVHDQLYYIHAGEFILFQPYVMHYSYGDVDAPFKRLLLYFHSDEINSAELLAALKSTNRVFRQKDVYHKNIHRLLEMIMAEQETPEAYHQETLNTLLNFLVLSIVKNKDEKPVPEAKDRIGKMISYIHAHYNEDISLEKLSQMFYVSPYYLCREFKRHTNRTIIQYINITRVMNAQRKFMETNMNVTAVSKEIGFSNLTHFNRVFKSFTGMTPSAYRQEFKNENKKQ